jgi:hypothetical protein
MKRRFKEHSKVKAKDLGQTADLINTLQQMEDRQRQLEQAFGDLDQNLDRVDDELIEGILEQNALCYENLAAVIEETTSNTNLSLALVSQRFTEEMEREREQYHYHVQSLVQRLDTYEQREHVKMELARRWLRQSVVLADFIQEQFDHERFLPGKLPKILRRLDMAQGDLAEGLPEASLQISQQVFVDLSELRLELEQRIVEWQVEYERTSRALNEFVAELELNSSVNAFGLEGEELAETVDVAYWSNGKYRELLNKSRHVLTLVSQDQKHLSIEELKQAQEVLPAIQEKFESIVYEARLNALNSQLRMNIAEKALQALENHGFKLNEAGYVGKDMRAPFMAQLDNSDGSRVTIQVLPTDPATQELTNELVVVTNHPYLKTEHEARLQWAELCRTLNEYNLNVSRPDIRSAPTPTMPERVQPFPVLNPQIRSKRQNNVR